MTDPQATGGSGAQQFYGQWAAVYDAIATYTPGVPALRQEVAAACRLEPGDTVVELGCGTGANLPYLRHAVGPSGTVVGVDFTGPVLERARDRTSRFENVHVVRGDAIRFPLSAERTDADAVVATFVVGMLPDPASAVDDWADLVGPGGRVVLANAARSERWYAPVVNAIFRAIVVCSTPPATKLRYDRDITRQLDERIGAAHRRLRDRSCAVAEASRQFGLVRLTGGEIAPTETDQ